jgi:hypothetical protein
MKSEIAAKLSDAITKTRQPRSDFRTSEARDYTQRLRPFLGKQDGLERFARGTNHDTYPDLQTRVEESTVRVPGEGEFDYPTTFWTVAFANFTISKYLKLVTTPRPLKRRGFQDWRPGIVAPMPIC